MVASIALQAFAALVLYFAISAAQRCWTASDTKIFAIYILTRNLLMFGAALCFLAGGAQLSLAADHDVGLGMLLAVAITGAIAVIWSRRMRHRTGQRRELENSCHREVLLFGTSLVASTVPMILTGKAQADGLLAGLIALRMIGHCIGERLCNSAIE
jgi:hypothetical protein